MSQSITLTLPDALLGPIQRTAEATRQPLEAVVLTALQASRPPLEGVPADVAPLFTQNVQQPQGRTLMSTSTDRPVQQTTTLVGPIVAAGLIIAVLRQLDVFVVFSLLLKVPYIVLLQFIASGVLGMAAFAGGIGSALLGLFLHIVFSLVIAAVFLLAATRLAVLRRNLLLGGLLYGVVVYFVMNFVVTPLSAAPPPEGIVLAVVVEGIIGHAVLIGLPLAFIARRNANRSM